ncbi:MAG: Coenzyme F420 hydrogenase/dehydrogenase, beta subunit C-terminal domain [Phycisphaerales bacterium]
MRLDVLPIERVVESGLCSGCGACAAAAPGVVRMVDHADRGRRPSIDHSATRDELAPADRVCPGSGLSHETPQGEWGPVLEVWQGYAADPAVRHAGSSGGLASALSIFCLERARMHGVLHTASRSDAPHLNETVMSTTREQVLRRTGSRYAPASPCEGLGEVERAPGPCVFIGKPCDVAAARALASERPALRNRLGLAVSIFCAGTPTTAGTRAMLRAMGVDDPDQLGSLRYRGEGWPGDARATHAADGSDRVMTYERAWGEILTRHKQWRCKVCADHTGEFADIAVGDAWHLRRAGDAGQSIVVVRTQRGRRVLHAAIAAGDLVMERVGLEELRASQPSLETTRGAVWGRVLALRMRRAPAPRFRGMRMARLWWTRLSLKDKARSIVGTWRRAAAVAEPSPRRGLYADGRVIESKVQHGQAAAPPLVSEGAWR